MAALPPHNTALQITAFNARDPTSSVQLVESAVPQPSAGEVLVNLKLRPVNPSDVLAFMGAYPGFQPQLPAVPGADGMGVVAAVGPGVTRFSPGQRVVAWTGWPQRKGNGSWQTYVVVPQDSLAVVPDSISDTDASQFTVNPVTAWLLLDGMELAPASWLVVSAAGSALGKMLLRTGKARGLRTVAIVRRQEAVQEALDEGATVALHGSGEDVVAGVKEATGGGADAAVDFVGGSLTPALVAAVKFGGTVWVVGCMGGAETKVNLIPFIFKDVRLRGFWLQPKVDAMPPQRAQHMVAEVFKYMEQGIFSSPAGNTFDLQDFKAAFADSTREARGNKTLLRS